MKGLNVSNTVGGLVKTKTVTGKHGRKDRQTDAVLDLTSADRIKITVGKIKANVVQSFN